MLDETIIAIITIQQMLKRQREERERHDEHNHGCCLTKEKRQLVATNKTG
jgi:hypothetical protein